MIWVLGSVSVYAQNTPKQTEKINDTLEIESTGDSLEYDIIILDPGFESYLASQAKPVDFYSPGYYENWNRQYVLEWNMLYTEGKYPDLIESYIDYDPTVDYGIDLNFKLYNYFQFFEHKYRVTLINRHH